MVRLGLIILMLLCVTITSVYAVWTYAGTNDIADAYAEAKITIADAELTGANGIYKIESNLVLVIDQAAPGDHHAKLLFESNNSEPIFLRVTFTPAQNAPKDVKDNGVPTELYFTTTTKMMYTMDTAGNYKADGEGVEILTFSNPSDGVFSPNVEWTKQPDGSFTYELSLDQLDDMIGLTQEFLLDTKAEHDAFRIALSGNILARVTDGVITE